jgi:hypothetical protein
LRPRRLICCCRGCRAKSSRCTFPISPRPCALKPSLRANGSRERAPDDRLREAIHSAANEEWIASSLSLLAITFAVRIHISNSPPCTDTASRSRRRLRARFARSVPPSEDQRAQGMPGAQCARSLACDEKKHTNIVTTVTRERPGIPRAMG